MSNSENCSDRSISLNGGGSRGNESASEGVEVYDEDMK